MLILSASSPSPLDGELTAEKLKSALAELISRLSDALPRLAISIIILVLGVLVIRYVKRLSDRRLKNAKRDPTVQKFLLSVITAALYAAVVTVSLTVLVPSAAASILALFSVCGVAVSLALKDTLANIASGVSVLIARPFKVGDYVKIGVNEGVVKDITLSYTIIQTEDNRLIHIPNSDAAKAQSANYSAVTERRLDLTVSVGAENADRAKAALLSLSDSLPLALVSPKPRARIDEIGASVKLRLSVYVKPENYKALEEQLKEKALSVFIKESIPLK